MLKDIDAIVVPTAPLNPKIEEVLTEPIKVNSCQGTYTNFVNLADMSALAIPAGFRKDGQPFGITLLSHKFNDYALLDLASRYMESYTKTVPFFYGALKEKLIESSISEELLPNVPRSSPQSKSSWPLLVHI